MIKHIIKTVIEVDYQDLEKLIEEVYELKEFNLASSEEYSNNTALLNKVDGEVSVYELEKILRRETYLMTRIYMNDLCRRGHLEKGEYLIRISW